jgi:hypothetical protein
MKKNLVFACLVAILFPGKVHAQTGASGFSIYNFNAASDAQISLWAAGGAVSTIKVDSGHFLTGSPQGNVQLKPNVSVYGIQYVSNAGSDRNDGLSWGTAKKTVFAALQALPNGSTSPPTAGTGTVYISSGNFHPSPNTGVWLMGPADPNYASPPAGWLRVTNAGGQGINIVGVPNNAGGPNPHMSTVTPSKPRGIGISNGDPTFWLSGTTEPINISNLSGGGGARFILIGQCSNGDRTGRCAPNNIVFSNVNGSANFNSGSGPCTDVTGSAYWIWFRDFGCIGNATLASGGRFSNQAAAMLFDGTGNAGMGLVFVKDANFAGGGIKFIPGVGTNSLYVDNAIEEGDFTHDIPPVVWFTAWSPSESAYLNNVQGADPGPTPGPCVRVDNSSIPIQSGGPVIISTNCPILGPATVLNSTQNNFLNAAVSIATPLRQGQLGFWANNVVGQTDVARRNDVLVAARFLNRASSNTATWVSSDPSNTTITTGLTDPFGGTGAAKATHKVAGTANFNMGAPLRYTSAVGDWIIVGLWEMGLGGDGNLTTHVSGCGSPTNSMIYQDNAYLFEDRWSFRWKAFKASNVVTTCIQTTVQIGNGAAPTIYGPVLYVVPSGTLSDNEIVDFATSMATTDIACPVGSICNPAGHPVRLTALSLNRSNQMTSVSGNSGQVAQSSGTLSRTKLKTADANGNIVDAGGSGTLGITFPSKTYASSAICNNTAAASAWNLPTSAAPTVSCRTGTNTQEGTLNFADADSAQFSLPLASDWTGAIDARLIFFSRDTRGTVIFQIATSCTATSGSTVDDIAFNTADVFTTITLNATADAQWETNKTSINVTGCSPSNTLQVKISRATDTASSRVSVKGLELTVRRAL